MHRIWELLRKKAYRISLYIRALGKWVLVSGITGILCGALGSAFHLGVDYVTGLRLSYPWLLWLLPVAGLAIAGIYGFF